MVSDYQNATFAAWVKVADSAYPGVIISKARGVGIGAEEPFGGWPNTTGLTLRVDGAPGNRAQFRLNNGTPGVPTPSYVSQSETSLADDAWHYLVGTVDGSVTRIYVDGSLVDEDAFIRAMRSNKIMAAGVDVLEVEPTPEDNPLIDMDNVLITPHMASFTQEASAKSMVFAMYNSVQVAKGEEPESVVLPDD